MMPGKCQCVSLVLDIEPFSEFKHSFFAQRTIVHLNRAGVQRPDRATSGLRGAQQNSKYSHAHGRHLVD